MFISLEPGWPQASCRLLLKLQNYINRAIFFMRKSYILHDKVFIFWLNIFRTEPSYFHLTRCFTAV